MIILFKKQNCFFSYFYSNYLRKSTTNVTKITEITCWRLEGNTGMCIWPWVRLPHIYLLSGRAVGGRKTLLPSWRRWAPSEDRCNVRGHRCCSPAGSDEAGDRPERVLYKNSKLRDEHYYQQNILIIYSIK